MWGWASSGPALCLAGRYETAGAAGGRRGYQRGQCGHQRRLRGAAERDGSHAEERKVGCTAGTPVAPL